MKDKRQLIEIEAHTKWQDEGDFMISDFRIVAAVNAASTDKSLIGVLHKVTECAHD